MLSLLKIKNVALIDDLVIEFGDRLNIISGETGSGKSIMLDSLGLCFGERGDKTLIRAGQTKLKVTAVFDGVGAKVRQFVVDKLGIDCDDQIVLDREYDISGKSVARINGEITTTNALREVSKLLVDLHGQHEHQAIVSRDYQLSIIDDFIGSSASDLLGEINSRIDEIARQKQTIDAIGGFLNRESMNSICVAIKSKKSLVQILQKVNSKNSLPKETK